MFSLGFLVFFYVWNESVFMYPFHVIYLCHFCPYFNICNMNADAPLSCTEQLTNFMRLESSFLSEV